MTELEYIAKIEEMNRAGRSRLNEESARRYAVLLKAGSDLSMTLSEEDEQICRPGQAILDIEDPRALERLNLWQGLTRLNDRERAAIKLFLKIRGIEPLSQKAAMQKERAEAEAVADGERAETVKVKRRGPRETVTEAEREEPPLSLYGLLTELRQATKNRRTSNGTPAYTLLMRALLLNDKFFWSSDATKRHLRLSGESYYENSQVILANLHNSQRCVLVKEAMKKALHQLEDEVEGPELRLDIARACVTLEHKMEQWKEWYDSNEPENGTYEGSEAQLVLQQLASMHKGLISHIYKGIAEDEMIYRLIHLFSLAIDASEGRFLPAMEPAERMEFLSLEERALVAVVTCGLPVERKLWKKEQLQPMLLHCLNAGVLVPAKGAGRFDRMVLAEGLEPLDLRLLCREELKAEKRRDLWNLLKDMLKAADPDKIRGTVLESVTGQLEELLELLGEGTDRERRSVLTFLIRCRWRNVNHEDHRAAILAMDKLLQWIERWPELALTILRDLIPGSPAERTAKTRMRDQDNCLIRAELYVNCASRCLELAMTEEDTFGYWAACTTYLAQKAWMIFIMLEHPIAEIHAQLEMSLGIAYLIRKYGELGGGVSGSEELRGEMVMHLIGAAAKCLEIESGEAQRQRETIKQVEGICNDQTKEFEKRELQWQEHYKHFSMEKAVLDGLMNTFLDFSKLLSAVGFPEEEMQKIPGFLWMQWKGFHMVGMPAEMEGGCTPHNGNSWNLLLTQIAEKIPRRSRIVGWEVLVQKMAAILETAESLPPVIAELERICSSVVNQGLDPYGTFGREIDARLRNLVS